MEVNTSSTINENMYDYINGFAQNPAVFIVLIVVILVYIVLFFSLGDNSSTDPVTPDSSSSSSSSSSISSSLMIAIVVAVLILLVFINLFKYFFGIDIVASLKDVFSNKPLLDIKVEQTVKEEPPATPSTPASTTGSTQVFNIPGNYYNYNDAKSLCQAYNSRLATNDEVEKAYNKGAEWCNYGWSDKQLALFPTQKSTYDKLQQVKGHENDCGRSGINGGYIANPNVKFGVNCYGKKPKMTEDEEALMQASTLYPKTNEEIYLENQVDYWKTKIDQILVSPFNHSSWNQ